MGDNGKPATNGLPKRASDYSVDTTTDSNANLPNAIDGGADDAVDDRGQWGSKAEFILSCVGLSGNSLSARTPQGAVSATEWLGPDSPI